MRSPLSPRGHSETERSEVRDLPRHSSEPIGSQILPSGVLGGDQRHTLLPAPRLDLLLSGDSSSRLFSRFPPDQLVNAISRGESPEHARTVLEDPSVQIVGNAGIEDARVAGEDVDEELAASHTGSWSSRVNGDSTPMLADKIPPPRTLGVGMTPMPEKDPGAPIGAPVSSSYHLSAQATRSRSRSPVSPSRSRVRARSRSWRIRSRVTPIIRPISSRVRALPSSSPK